MRRNMKKSWAKGVMGGHIPLMFDGMVTSLPLINSGKLRPYAIAARTRSPLLPSVPTFAEVGIADMDFSNWIGVVGSSQLPPEISARVGQLEHEADRVHQDAIVELFDQETADKLPFDHLDSTKLIPEEDVPVRIVGTLTLNRNVDNFFAETEQVAYCTQNIVPGIDFSDDPLLHGRNFSYLDTQLKRLGGPNFTHIPVNREESALGLCSGAFMGGTGSVALMGASGGGCVLVLAEASRLDMSQVQILLEEILIGGGARLFTEFQAIEAAAKDDIPKLVPEGIEGRVALKGPLADTVFQIVGGLRAAMGYCGCATITAMKRDTRFIRMSEAGLRESHPHDIVITKEAPNYHK